MIRLVVIKATEDFNNLETLHIGQHSDPIGIRATADVFK